MIPGSTLWELTPFPAPYISPAAEAEDMHGKQQRTQLPPWGKSLQGLSVARTAVSAQLCLWWLTESRRRAGEVPPAFHPAGC